MLLLGNGLGKGVDNFLFFFEGGFRLLDIDPDFLKFLANRRVIVDQAPKLGVGLTQVITPGWGATPDQERTK